MRKLKFTIIISHNKKRQNILYITNYELFKISFIGKVSYCNVLYQFPKFLCKRPYIDQGGS